MLKVTQKQTLDNLRSQFKYDEKGRPDIYSYGAFKAGLTDEEINDYLRVRTGNWSITKVRKFYDLTTGADTCAVWDGLVEIEREMMKVRGSVILHYRHDVERYADKVLLGTPTYFD